MDKMAEGSRRRRLSAGLQRLETWSETASQIEKNAVYDALFAVSNRSIQHAYAVLTRPVPTRGFVILVRDNLVVTVGLPTTDTFCIEYVGPPRDDSGDGGDHET
jgi:hypothetical protein